MTGRGPLGMVLVNRLRDADKAQAASDKLRDFANDVIGQQVPPDVKVSFKHAKVGDMTVNYLATPLVTPSWMIQNGNLYLGLYPQSVAAGAGHVSREGKSILDNERFTALRKRLGGQKATTYQFYDLPRSATTNYQFWMLASSFGKAGDLLGVDTPVMLLPQLPTLMQHMSVAGSVTWVDAVGWHFRGVTPFPGGTLVASETGGAMDLQGAAMAASVLLPSLSNARESANRVKSASNLRQIGMAMIIYANENNGAFPPDMAGTMTDLVPQVYISPRTAKSVPPGLEGDALKKWVNESSDYVYLGTGKTSREPASVVIAYEKPDGLTDGINILYADGHVEFVEMGRAQQIIEAGRHVDPPGAEGL